MNFKFAKDKAKMSSLFKSMKILKEKDIFELEIAKFMYAYYYSMLPENFDNNFKHASKHFCFGFLFVHNPLPYNIYKTNYSFN